MKEQKKEFVVCKEDVLNQNILVLDANIMKIVSLEDVKMEFVLENQKAQIVIHKTMLNVIKDYTVPEEHKNVSSN